MADLKRWFKVWGTILDDPHFQELSLEQIGRWTLLGAMLSSVGSKGKLSSPNAARRLREVLRFDTVDTLKASLRTLPNVLVEEGENRHDEFTVTMLKWNKYQEDTTQAARAKASRAKRRGEEKREDEIHTRARLNGHDQGFDAFWTAYPRHEAKTRALKAWTALHPSPELTATLLAAIEQHKQRLWAQAPPDKIPHPATWLNGRRWEDDLPPPGKDPYANFPKS